MFKFDFYATCFGRRKKQPSKQWMYTSTGHPEELILNFLVFFFIRVWYRYMQTSGRICPKLRQCTLKCFYDLPIIYEDWTIFFCRKIAMRHTKYRTQNEEKIDDIDGEDDMLMTQFAFFWSGIVLFKKKPRNKFIAENKSHNWKRAGAISIFPNGFHIINSNFFLSSATWYVLMCRESIN